MAIISNETSHDRNVAFTNNNKLIRIVREMAPTTDTFHFWSDGCAGQFRSCYVFQSFCAYPADIKLTWDMEKLITSKVCSFSDLYKQCIKWYARQKQVELGASYFYFNLFAFCHTLTSMCTMR